MVALIGQPNSDYWVEKEAVNPFSMLWLKHMKII